MITLQNVAKRYDIGAAVLHDVSLALEAGGFYFLTGPKAVRTRPPPSALIRNRQHNPPPYRPVRAERRGVSRAKPLAS